MESYSCDPLNGIIKLKINNNGRFNVDGIIAKFSDDVSKEPIVMLQPTISGMPGKITPGHYSFPVILSPGISEDAEFSPINESNLPYMASGGTVKIVQIQPFQKDKKKIACRGTAIKEPLTNPECRIVPAP